MWIVFAIGLVLGWLLGAIMGHAALTEGRWNETLDLLQEHLRSHRYDYGPFGTKEDNFREWERN